MNVTLYTTLTISSKSMTIFSIGLLHIASNKMSIYQSTLLNRFLYAILPRISESNTAYIHWRQTVFNEHKVVSLRQFWYYQFILSGPMDQIESPCGTRSQFSYFLINLFIVVWSSCRVCVATWPELNQCESFWLDRKRSSTSTPERSYCWFIFVHWMHRLMQ